MHAQSFRDTVKSMDYLLNLYRDTVQLMDYVLNLYETPSPSAWRSRRPDDLLPFPAPPVNANSNATRVWAGPISPNPFSTSPPPVIGHLPASRVACHGEGMVFQTAQIRTMADSLAQHICARLTADGRNAEEFRVRGYEGLGPDILAQHEELVRNVDQLRVQKGEE